MVEPLPAFDAVRLAQVIDLTMAEKNHLLSDVDADHNGDISPVETEDFEAGSFVVLSEEGPDKLRLDGMPAQRYARWSDLGEFEGPSRSWGERTLTDVRMYHFGSAEENGSSRLLSGEPDTSRDPGIRFGAPPGWVIWSINGRRQDFGATQTTFMDDSPYAVRYVRPSGSLEEDASDQPPIAIMVVASLVVAWTGVVAAFVWWRGRGRT